MPEECTSHLQDKLKAEMDKLDKLKIQHRENLREVVNKLDEEKSKTLIDEQISSIMHASAKETIIVITGLMKKNFLEIQPFLSHPKIDVSHFDKKLTVIHRFSEKLVYTTETGLTPIPSDLAEYIVQIQLLMYELISRTEKELVEATRLIDLSDIEKILKKLQTSWTTILSLTKIKHNINAKICGILFSGKALATLSSIVTT